MHWEKTATLELPDGVQVVITIKPQGIYTHLQDPCTNSAAVMLSRSSAAELGATLVSAAAEHEV